MPVTYVCDRELALIRTRCSGNVTFAEVIEHFRTLENDSSLPTRLDVLLDLSEMESLPETGQLEVVSRQLSQLKGKVQWGTFAIVANRDALFGLSRVFEVFAEKSFGSSRVFRDHVEAEQWLASNRHTGSPAETPGT